MTATPIELLHEVERALGALFPLRPYNVSCGEFLRRTFELPGPGYLVRFREFGLPHEASMSGVALIFRGDPTAAAVALLCTALEAHGREVPPELAGLSVRLFLGGHVGGVLRAGR